MSRTFPSSSLGTGRQRVNHLILASTLLIGFLLGSANVAAQALPGFNFPPPTGEFPKTDFDNYSVDLSEILSGGPPRDGIPPIDNPFFESFAEAGDWLGATEPVIALRVGNTERAYPLQILIFHEIVNDVIEDKPVAVTFCPLCNASIVFDATVEGQVLDFGTTGRLRRSDLVMYDRQTESWWQQFTGTGIVGDFNETQLKQIPSQIVSFEVFQNEYPEGEVLSKSRTGASRPYGNNPYQGYDDINSFKDGTLVDAETNSEWSQLGSAISGSRKGQRLTQIDHGVHFAFAWLAFDPEATVIKEP